MAYDNRDSIDFGKEEIHKLFRSIFVPTLLGMLFNMAFILTDGIFVGHGIGPNGLASINLVAPVMMCLTGIGMMFGIGSSVVAAIHLSHENLKAARINLTQGMIGAVMLSVVIVALLYLFPNGALRLLGTSEELLDSTREYLVWFVPTCLLLMIQIVGGFGIRLDGSPKYAMYCSIIPACINIFFDYLFIFPCHMGLKGAALATDIGTAVGALMVGYYFIGPVKTLKYYKLKASGTSMRLFARNAGYMVKVGFSGFIGEFALSMMMLCGNRAFGKYLGDTGVAAYSVVCYLYPIVYNVFYAVSTSAQPIISFNHGAQKDERVSGTFRFSVGISLAFAAGVTVLMWLFSAPIVSVFLERGTATFPYASEGLPFFALGFVMNGFNVSAIGYFQSVANNRNSTLLMSMRGVIMPIVTFWVFPMLWGTLGLWLAMPASELITTCCAVAFLKKTPLAPQSR